MNKNKLSIIPISKNEMGHLKGGFSVYTVETAESINKSGSVSLRCNCGCGCNATCVKHL